MSTPAAPEETPDERPEETPDERPEETPDERPEETPGAGADAEPSPYSRPGAASTSITYEVPAYQPVPVPGYSTMPEPTAAELAAPERPAGISPVAKVGGIVGVVLVVAGLAVLSYLRWPSGNGEDTVVNPGPTTAADPQMAARIDVWLREGGQLVIDNLAGDYKGVAAAGAASDVDGMRAACASMQRSAEAAQAHAPIPDPEAQDHWSASLAQSARSATDCLAGLDSNNNDLIVQAGHEAGASARESALMHARFAAVRGN